MLPFDPKKPLFGFTARFPHAKRRIHLFADERFVYFRPKNAPEDWVGALWPHQLLSFREKSHLVGTIEHEISQGHFFRVWAFNNTQIKQTWQVHWHPQMGCFFPQYQSEKDIFFFPQPSLLNIFKTSTQVLCYHFQEELQNYHSDLNASLLFCGLSKDERSWFSIRWVHGSRRELEMALRSSFWLDD